MQYYKQDLSLTWNVAREWYRESIRLKSIKYRIKKDQWGKNNVIETEGTEKGDSKVQFIVDKV